MTALEVFRAIREFQAPLLNTRDVADTLRMSVHSAGKHLETLREAGFLEKISRGKWIIKDSGADPLQISEFITAPSESYISLQSALFYHGIIEQIPSRVYAVTVDRTRVVETPLGIYSFHHCNPEFFIGYDFIKPYLKMATPEKALIDYFYFAPTKTRQFTKLPEVEFPKRFSWRKVEQYCETIPSKRTRSLVWTKLSRYRR